MSEFEAVVVGAVDLGEADRIFRVLTADQGRVSFVVRGVRSSRKRWAGVFDLGNVVRCRMGSMRASLPRLNEAECLSGPRRARQELDRVALLAYGLEVCAGLAPEHDEASKLYRLLRTWLLVLEADVAPASASRVALEGKALTFAGIAPRLVRCVRCGDEARNPLRFDAESGGVLHEHCGGGRMLDADVAAVVEGLRRTPLAETLGKEVPAEARSLLADFIEFQLARASRSRGLVDELGL